MKGGERDRDRKREMSKVTSVCFFFINLMIRGSTKVERKLSLKLPVIRFSN